MTGNDISQQLQAQIRQASEARQPLSIIAGGSKAFLGRPVQGEILDVSQHSGIIDYDPRELVITARIGTLLQTIEQTLADAGQMLAFEPPHFGDNATLGGTIATGLSGPRRPHAGAARDFVLGCSLLNGAGEHMHFGGRVMKNVAGYDVSRLMTGAYGTLGVMLDVSLKVLPKPAMTTTLFHECSEQHAIDFMRSLATQPLPVDAACYYKGQCYIRLSGSEQSIRDAEKKLPGEALSERSHFWKRLREHELSFFKNPLPLWRIAVKPDTRPLPISGEWLLDWGGAQRWLYSDTEAATIRSIISQHGGHVSLFRGSDRSGAVFQPLPEAMLKLHQRIKHSFDPAAIFNIGRMYAEI